MVAAALLLTVGGSYPLYYCITLLLLLLLLLLGCCVPALSKPRLGLQILAVVVLFILYSPVARTMLSVFNRYPHGVASPASGAVTYYLEEDLSREVGSPSHKVSSRELHRFPLLLSARSFTKVLLVLGGIGSAVYVLGLPLAALALLYRGRHSLQVSSSLLVYLC